MAFLNDPALMGKLVYLLGISNLLGLGIVFITCRCFPGMRWLKPFWGAKWYQKLYRTHCWWWYFFLLSVLLHAVFAIVLYGNPFLK
ncbi:MAG: hypothetical protein A2991_00935 [Candidatus Terrybacteria bacterium RIFCSPLOWO2_01_FULL_58_14]|uniref:Ferric oxidoreductase domain-containing protein n=1 Tax=Candidatus Terrybacteria bacterium RIFCSPLOWO2_01_FULL_58_14 TaxID=1802369 RepID=A0A1G2PXL9_9BACT|nr:MAG: hypothetical protein A2991_00935 [Candidatus Terrybacteria bacterium RIFCSPLOWO2_01_FULL_58_14]